MYTPDKAPAKNIIAEHCTALLFPSFNMPMQSPILDDIQRHLKHYRINSRVVPTLVIQNNHTEFRDIERDDQLMLRLISVIEKILSDIEASQRRHVLLIGIAGGTRLMVAYALARKLKLAQNAGKYDIPGLVAFNIYSHLRFSKSTPTQVTDLQQINHMDIKTNLARLNDTLVYDIYADIDSLSSETADSRRLAFDQAGLQYKQISIACGDIEKDIYYEKQNEDFFVYTEVSGHNLRNRYIKNEDGTFHCVHRLHGSYDSPVENSIDHFLVDIGVCRLQ